MQKQLLITFDYELFLGSASGSVEECMILPTQKLLRLLNNYNVHAVFFADTTYLMKLKEKAADFRACDEDFNKVSEQICEIIRQGHYVYPHIHPHWLDAQYLTEKNQWSLTNISRYRFHNVEEDLREKIFDESVHLLKSIIHPKFPQYQVNAHRAGGWCIQPFSDYKPLYLKHGISFDFSVIGGFYQFTDAQYFDFTNAPLKSIYRFENDVCEETDDGSFIQFNISSVEIEPALGYCNKIWLKLQYRLLNDHTFNRGIGQQTRELTGVYPVSETGKNLGSSSWERVSIELMTALKLKKYQHFFENNQHMHFISHPKMITRHNLSIFNKFLEKVFDKYSVETDFHLMIP